MKILCLGSSGFIGQNLVERLMKEGHEVWGADIKDPEFVTPSWFNKGDLRDPLFCQAVINQPFDRVYQLAADMGGAGYIFSGENDADVMHNSATINLNVAHFATLAGVKQLFYSSSACVYPNRDTQYGVKQNTDFKESDAYPAMPDNDYGWEKLFSERVYQAYHRNKALNIRIARFHNTFGPYSTWDGGREKAPAAICRKVIEAYSEIKIWGDGNQTRSFTYIDEVLDGIELLMQSNLTDPVNIGSDYLISINELAAMCMEFKGKRLRINHIEGPVGMRDRNSDNTFIYEKLGWKPTAPLKDGMAKLYAWIKEQHGKA